MYDEYNICDDDIVTVTKMGHVVEMQYMQKRNYKATIKKLNKDKYINLQTGELKKFEHMKNRKDSYNSLRQTFKRLRYLINNNFQGNSNELFVTLTYGGNMTDTKRLYSDLDKFIKRLRYEYKAKTSIDYITVVEPHKEGGWHCHLLLRFNDLDYIYIPNKFENKNPVDAPLYNIWGHGYVRIQRLEKVDNVGAYLTAYLTDVELKNDEDIKENIERINDEGLKVKQTNDGKMYIKGARLKYYPPGMNIYRKSKGIKMPDRQTMKYGKAKKKVAKGALPSYSRVYNVEKNDFENTIVYEQYNLKRLKNSSEGI